MPDPTAAAVPDWLAITVHMAGGLALFLFGLERLATNLRTVAGDRMRAALARLTGSRWLGLLTGAGVTAVIQSSTVTTVLLVGFVSAGVMSLSQAIGVVLGANIGTTITAQVLAFRITDAALPLIALGCLPALYARRPTHRAWGGLILGLGLVFYGIALMTAAMTPLRTYAPFIAMMHGMENPLLGMAVGAFFAAAVHSSSATTGIVVVLAGQGLVSLEGGLALILGANVGTCVTAPMAAFGKSREAVRVAAAHVLFNLTGALLWLALVPQLAWMVRELSPAYPDLDGLTRRAAEVPRQIANAHTLFNLANAALFIGFTPHFARLLERLFPDRPLPLPPAAAPLFLSRDILRTPSLALDAARAELEHLGRLVGRMMDAIMPAALTGDGEELEAVAAMDADVDALHGAMIDYLRQISQEQLTPPQTARFMRLAAMANALENVGDVIETDLVQLGLRRIEGAVTVSPPTQQLLRDLHARAGDALRLAVQAAVARDAAAARRVVAMKPAVAALAHQAAEHGAQRLGAPEPNRQRVYTREMEMIEKLRRIYYYAKRIAHLVIEEAADSEAAAAPPPLPATAQAEG